MRLLGETADILQRCWDFAVAEPPSQQRLRLIRQFINVDEIPRE